MSRGAARAELRRVLARGPAFYREHGPAQAAARAASRLASYLVYPLQRLRHRRAGFECGGVRYRYFIHHYNPTWRNERAVELAIAEQALAGCAQPVLEVGNVLSRYLGTTHEVIDKYEAAPGVKNIDVVDLEARGVYGFIVSISTLEHVGWDEEPRDPGKVEVAIDRLRGALKPGGELLVTCPLGANSHLDELIAGGSLAPAQEHFLTRPGRRLAWIETARPEPPFGPPDPRGRLTIWVARFHPD